MPNSTIFFCSVTKNRKRQHLSSKNSAMNSSNFSRTHLAAAQFQPLQLPESANAKRHCPKITQYIKDRPSRLKSYFRRRHIPFKRTFDMNLQCGTTSLLIQISDDIEECLYHGDERLVERFLDTGQGLRLSHVHQIIQQGKISYVVSVGEKFKSYIFVMALRMC